MLKIGSALITFLVVMYGYLVGYNLDTPYFMFLALIVVIGLLSLRYIVAVMSGMPSRNRVAYLTLLALTLYVTIVGGSPYLMFALFLATAYLSTGLGVRTFMWHFFAASVFMFSMTMVLYFTGFLADNTIYRTVEDVTYTRLSLGFLNPNSPMLYALPILASGGYLFLATKKKVRHYLLAVGLVLGLYLATNSRTGLYTGLIFLVATILPGWIISLVTVRGVLVRYLFLLLAAGSLAVALLFSDGTALNEALSGRPEFWRQFILASGPMPTLFGADISEDSLVDNMYIYLLYGAGILSFLLYSWVFVAGTRLLLKSHDWKIYVCIVVLYLVYGLFETSIMMTSVNVAVPLLIYYIVRAWRNQGFKGQNESVA